MDVSNNYCPECLAKDRIIEKYKEYFEMRSLADKDPDEYKRNENVRDYANAKKQIEKMQTLTFGAAINVLLMTDRLHGCAKGLQEYLRNSTDISVDLVNTLEEAQELVNQKPVDFLIIVGAMFDKKENYAVIEAVKELNKYVTVIMYAALDSIIDKECSCNNITRKYHRYDLIDRFISYMQECYGEESNRICNDFAPGMDRAQIWENAVQLREQDRLRAKEEARLSEKKKARQKILSNIGWTVLLIGVIGLAIGAYYIKVNMPFGSTINGKKEILMDTQYESTTAKADCRLCGENHNDIPYWGENNIGVLDLNTFYLYNLGINRYDDEHNLIEQKAGYMSMGSSRMQNGESLYFITEYDRGYAEGTITLNENSILSFDSLSSYLCSDCLTDLMNEYTYKEDHWNIALINFENKKIKPLQECITGFSFGDFHVKSRYDKDNEKIELLVWYSPIRYK